MVLKKFLCELSDPRRKQGKRYEQHYIILFSTFAILSGADSYRKISSFIDTHYKTLKKHFNLKWKKAPSYSAIRQILLNINKKELETKTREYSGQILCKNKKNLKNKLIAIDGKALKHSYDNFNDKPFVQILSAFLIDEKIILAHVDLDKKNHEIQGMQDLIKNLKLNNCIFIADALHCQSKTLKIIHETNNDAIIQVKKKSTNIT